MTSEIRANTLKNRVGLGTIEYSNTGPVISGVTTSNNFKTGTTNVHNVGIEAAGINVLGADTPIGTGSTIYNSGAAVFTGVVTATSFSGIVKATNLTSDRVIFTTTNGQLEASGNLTYNGTTLASGSPLDINSDLDVDGHTNLDNVSVAGVSTFSGNVHLPDNVELNLGTNNDLEIFHNDDDAYIRNNKGALILRNNNQTGDADASQIYIQATPAENSIQCSPNGAVTLYHNNVPQLITTTAGVSLYRDLDVDGHTNLDNVSISGITTFAQSAGAVTVPAGGDIRIANSGGWTGEYGGKIQQYLNFLYIQGGSNGIRFRYTDGNDRWVIGSGGHFDPGAGGTYDIGNTGNRVRQIHSTHANVSGISTLASINVSGSGGINISYSGADLTMNSAGGIFTGNGGNATNPIVANVSDTNTGIFYPGADSIAVTTGGSERLRITSTGKVGVNYAGTPPEETFMIRPASDETVSRLTLSHLSSGNSYGARISSIGGSSKGFDLATQFNSSYITRARMTDRGVFQLSPSNDISSVANSFVLNLGTEYSGTYNVYAGLTMKNFETNGGNGMAIHTTSGQWDLYTNAGSRYGLSIAHNTNASSANSRFYLTHDGYLTVGTNLNARLATSRKGNSRMHIVGGGLSIGPNGNTGVTQEGGRYVLGWYMVTHTTGNSYTHLITDLWAGGSPHGNNEYIMGGFHIHGHQYSGGASVSRERIYFHNWSGSYPGLSNSNPGNWSAGSAVYTNSAGYVTLRLTGGNYRGYIIDLVQHAWYPARDITVTTVTTSDSSTI